MMFRVWVVQIYRYVQINRVSAVNMLLLTVTTRGSIRGTEKAEIETDLKTLKIHNNSLCL